MLAAEREVVKPINEFQDWFHVLQEKACQRVDPMAARYLWERGYSIYDAMVKIVGR